MKSFGYVIVIFSLLMLFSYNVKGESDAQTVLSNFASWLNENGVQTKVNLGIFDDMRFGGVAGVDVPNGEKILTVPMEMVLSQRVVNEHPVVQLYNDYKLLYEPMMIYILYERLNTDSFFQPYFQILPTDFSFHPIFWSDEDIALTKGTGLPSHIEERRKVLKATYNYINENFVSKHDIFPEGYFSYQNYVWSFMVVLTRAWMIDNSLMLVPLADMLNHNDNAGAGSIFQDEAGNQFFYINATRDYAQSEQVYDSYGAKTNFDLLKGYGFVLEENQWNGIHLTFELKTNNLIQNIVEPILEKADPNYRNVIVRPNRRPDALLRMFRISFLEFDELKYINDVIAGGPATLVNELKSYRGAISALTQALQGYPNTIEEDKELLESGTLTPNQRTAVLFRKIEKEITQNAVLVLGKMWENILLEGRLPLEVELR